MSTKLFPKQIRRLKRWLRRRRGFAFGCCAIFIAGTIGYATYMHSRHASVDPSSYQPLLQLIGQAESKDNYDAYFGNAHNTSLRLTAMSIADVMQWQADYIRHGSPSDAVGRYQIISTTLAGLVQQLRIDTRKKFDQATQDRLAIALLERRGSEAYVNHQLDQKAFAANLAQEWAALPKVLGSNPSSSYYAGDGLNASLVSIESVLKAIEPIRAS